MNFRRVFKKLSLSIKVGLIVFISLFIFVCLLGYLSISREADRILNHTFDLLEEFSLKAEKELSENMELIIAIENNQQLTQEQKIIGINEKLQSVFSDIFEGNQGLLLGYYSKELGGVVLNKQDENLPLGFKLPPNHPSLELYTQGGIQKEINTVLTGHVVRYVKPVYWEGNPVGHIYATIPYSKYLEHIYSSVPFILGLTILAMLLALLVTLFIFHSINKHIMVFSRFIEDCGKKPSEELDSSEMDDSLPIEFQPMVRKYVAQIKQIRELNKERRRAEALAEIDRDKTAFFSNVSHEFRTPLTLILGPLEDLLQEGLPKSQHQPLALIYRNALRLLKLVNTLLDFSRIEAGRVQAVYEPVDLAKYTAELASSFRSVIEKAGMDLKVDCPALPESVYVNRDMWEKTVLNLLSNAFKFTFEGSITVKLAWHQDHVELAVSDTGIGIAEKDIENLFVRFHRIQGVKARTHEGTGIGLALVKELVKLHGGSIEVQSQVEQGSVFTVSVPTGSKHLPRERVNASRNLASTATGVSPYVEEALRWLPENLGKDVSPMYLEDQETRPEVPVRRGTEGARILVVDDNADMCGYLSRLLSQWWTVETAHDGLTALESALAKPPDLVLADVMMPGLDGFELLKQLRAAEMTQDIPIILLSARSGEEARVEGIEIGADDYMIKPFSARELVARVGTHLFLSQTRLSTLKALQESERKYRALSEQLREADLRKDEFLGALSHEIRNPLASITLGLALLEKNALDTKKSKHAREIMSRQVSHLSRLVDDLLDVTRIARNKIDLHKEQIELNELAAWIVEEHQAMFQEKGVALIIETFPRSLYLDVDPVRLSQAIGNLLHNAMKFTNPGGFTRVELDLDEAQKLAEIRIEDNGCGIAPELLKSMYIPFIQGGVLT